MEDSQFVTLPEGDHDHTGYVPGVCNIGPEEIQRRRQALNFSYIGLIAVAGIALFLPDNPLLSTILLLIAFATGAGTGVSYLQVREKFCVAYGSMGVFNFEELGTTNKIQEENARKADRAKVRSMFTRSAIFGLIYTAVVFGLISLF